MWVPELGGTLCAMRIRSPRHFRLSRTHLLSAFVVSISLVLGLAIGGSVAGSASSAPSSPGWLGSGSAAGPTEAAVPVTTAGFGFAGGSGLLWLNDADLGRELDAVKRTKATWLRVTVDWNSIEAAKNSYNWSTPDRIINAARARGLKVLANVVSSPPWSRPAGTFFTAPPTNNSDLSAFLKKFIARYGSKVTNYQIWNEPNLPIFFGWTVDAARYTSLLKAAYSTIKSAQWGSTVIAAGLARSGGWNSPPNFVTAMYNAGAKGSFDALAMHPYVFPGGLYANPENAVTDIPAVRNLMIARGDGAKKIWFTELGAPTGTAADAVSEWEQAKQITDVMGFAVSAGFVGPTFIYSIRDTGTNLADREQNFGAIYKHDWTPKYAASVLGAV
ncbi:Cellulase (glycosyl hydrolase family 5) [Gordonia westfalica]|uniref:Cellulase (Glycosyl hydrolase family 5) n=1 Tax=Gordonia westfalica TaxID=158898 RepID=A0A1H2JXJ6_9ACTN|nr:Cellulase (glycosyl hydrolase family 5) [Gordonia westfalica]